MLQVQAVSCYRVYFRCMNPILRTLLLAAFAFWAVALLYVLATPAGRYIMHDQDSTTVVLDTRTGALHYYNWSAKEWQHVAPPESK